MFDEALVQYKLELSVRQKLVARNPNNAGWKKNLENTHKKIDSLPKPKTATSGAPP